MIDSLKYARRIEADLGIEHQKADAAAFIARDMLVEATGNLATKGDLTRLTLAFGGMLVVAVGVVVLVAFRRTLLAPAPASPAEEAETLLVGDLD